MLIPKALIWEDIPYRKFELPMSLKMGPGWWKPADFVPVLLYDSGTCSVFMTRMLGFQATCNFGSTFNAFALSLRSSDALSLIYSVCLVACCHRSIPIRGRVYVITIFKMVLILCVLFLCPFESDYVKTNAKYSGFSHSLNALFGTKNMIEPWVRLCVLGGRGGVYMWFHS